MAKAHRADWFNLIDIDGPFLDPQVLAQAFPQGFADWLRGEPATRRYILDAYEEWSNQGCPLSLQHAWLDIVFMEALVFPHDRYVRGQAVPRHFACDLPISRESC